MMNEIGQWLLASSLQLALLIALILLLRRPLARYLGAGQAYAMWLLVPLLLLLGMMPTPSLSGVADTPQWLILPTMEFSVSSSGPITAQSAAVLTVIVAAWLVVAGWLLLRLGRELRQARRLLIDSKTPFNGEHGPAWLSDQVPCPLTLGCWRPRILLPHDFSEQLSASQQSLVLAHEACHARRRDNLANLLARGLCCIFWFHPLVHLAWHYFRIDQELACDAHVLAGADAVKRRDYGHALLTIGGGRSCDSGGLLRLHAGWTSPMKERIMMLKHHNNSRVKALAGGTLLLAMALAVSAVSMAGPDTMTNQQAQLAADKGSTQSIPIETDPAPIVRVQPRYPRSAAVEGVEGRVLMEFTITTKGEVRDVVVLESEPPEVFDGQAVMAMEQWRFQPVEVDGDVVETRARQVIDFSLDK